MRASQITALQVCYNGICSLSKLKFAFETRDSFPNMGMTGFDGRGWFRNASRAAPNS